MRKSHPAWNKGSTKETDSRIKGHPAWNKGLTKKTDPRITWNGCAKDSEKEAERRRKIGFKISIALKGRKPKFLTDGTHYEKGHASTEEKEKLKREKISKTLMGHPSNSTLEGNKKISIALRNNFLNGIQTPSKSKIYEAFGIKFRSSWEVECAIWLNTKNICWEYEKYRFKLSTGEIYIPDFYLPQFDVFIEVKGNKYGKNGFRKPIQFIKENPDKKLYILDSEGHKKIKKIIGKEILNACCGK